MNAPIGVFDSGVGGLTVAREIMRQLPEESMIYFGDTARVPYGTKSKDTIVRYSRQIVNFLLSKGVKAVVIACNTASALALADLQELYNVPIIVLQVRLSRSSHFLALLELYMSRNGFRCSHLRYVRVHILRFLLLLIIQDRL